MNQIKTVLLLGTLTGLLLGAGYFFGGQQGALIALILSAVMNFGSYWFSDKIVLSLYGAKKIPPETDPHLHEMIDELAKGAAIPKPKVYLVDMPSPNAFATGRNKNHAAIAVTTGILSLLDRQELRAVLAHELSHITNRDILVSSIAATIAGALSYLAQMAYFGAAFGGSRDGQRGGGNAIGILIIMILTPILATLIHLAISRSREFMADNSGAKLSKEPLALASALKKLHDYSRRRPLEAEPKYEATAHLFIVNPFKASTVTSIFSTHPPVEERVTRLEKIKI